MVQVRKASIEDFNAISKTKNKIYKTKDSAKEHYNEYLKFNLAKDTHAVYVLEDKKKCVGIISGRLYTTALRLKNRNRGCISFFYVKKGYEKYSKQLLSKLLSWFKSRKTAMAYFEVGIENKYEIDFYIKSGFKQRTIKLVKEF